MPKINDYSREALEAAILDVNNGMSKKAAAKKHGVPRSTIQFRLSDKFKKAEPGPTPILSKEEENTLIGWIINCCRKGFPRRKEDLQLSVQELLTQDKRPNPFKNNQPGLGWYQAFLKRHPEIVSRTPEGVTPASACVSEGDIQGWFKEIETVLKEENATDVLKDPKRVFNGDETNFLLCPKNSKVLAPKGIKNVYEIEKGKAKACVTAMFSFSAAGEKVPPMLIFPYQRLPQAIINSVPDSWGIGHSDNGWMKAELFYEYIANVFNTYLEQNQITRPVILFVDGHKSHLSYQLSQLCSELKIVLVALYPNATRILQPADVAAFRPIKSGWKEAVMNWRRANPTDVLIKENVAPILKAVFDNIKPEILVNGFKACGLCPWDSKNIDFTKCLGKKRIQEHQRDGNKTITLDEFEGLIGEEVLQKFLNIEENNAKKVESPEFYSLFRVWEEFQRQDTSKSVTTLVATKSSDVLPAATNSETISHDHSYATPKKVGPDTHAENQKSINYEERMGSGTSSLAEILHWPETPKRKGKKQTERVPYVVTSKQWKSLYEQKLEKKASEEQEKAERKRKREEKKLDKELLEQQKQVRKNSKERLAGQPKKKKTKTDLKQQQKQDAYVRENKGFPMKESKPCVSNCSNTPSQATFIDHTTPGCSYINKPEQGSRSMTSMSKSTENKPSKPLVNPPNNKLNVSASTKFKETDDLKSSESNGKYFTNKNTSPQPFTSLQNVNLDVPVPITQERGSSISEIQLDLSTKKAFRGKKPHPENPTGLCYACGTNFKDAMENQSIECDLCDKMYHLKCIKEECDFEDKIDPIFVCKNCMEFQFEVSKELNIDEFLTC